MDGETDYVSGVHIYALLYDPLCFIAYRIHSTKRLGVYKIFRDFFIRGRRLFKIQYIYIKRSQFHDLYVNILLQYMT